MVQRDVMHGAARLSQSVGALAAGDVVWQAVLSLVLMNPRKGKGGKKVSQARLSCCPIHQVARLWD